MGDSGNGITWGKAAQFILPFILTALLSIIGFVVIQIMNLKDTNASQTMELKEEIAEQRLCEAQHYAELRGDMKTQEVRLKTLTSKIDDFIRETRGGNDSP